MKLVHNTIGKPCSNVGLDGNTISLKLPGVFDLAFHLGHAEFVIPPRLAAYLPVI